MDVAALFKMSYGMYIVSSKKDEEYNAQIANVAFQVAIEPDRIAVCINKKNYTHDLILESNVLGITVLTEETTMEFIGKFGFKSGRDINKLEGTKYEIGTTGVPLITEFASSVIEGKVISRMDIKEYTMFIIEVVDSKIISKDNPMTYDYYHKVKKGKAPKTAPTYGSNNI